MAQGLPVLCEHCDGNAAGPWLTGSLAFAPYDALVDAAQALLVAPERRAALARQALCTAALLQAGTARRAAELAQRLAAMPPVHRLDVSAQIQADLRRSAAALPPPADQRAAPVPLAQRPPGQGRWGRWGVALLLVFTLLSAWFTRPR